MNPIRDLESLNAVRAAGLAKVKPARPRIAVGMGTCGAGNGAESVFHAFADAIDKRGLDADLVQTGCFGFCAEEPLVNVWVPGQPLLILHRIQQDHVGRVLDGLRRNAIPDAMILCKVERWDHITAALEYGFGYSHVPSWEEVPFYSGQKKVVMRNCGFINPTDIDEFIAIGGYRALYDVLVENAPLAVIERIKKARLRGRGGGGFPTGLKFESLRKANGTQKYLICNADEGDPGAYMNRNELEGDPHSLLEGMAIGGYVTGATQGIIYVRAEYPLAVQRLRTALSQARSYGLIGKNIFGSGFDFDIDLVENAGAFVCGEETALIASLEGLPGRARARPPYPAEEGLWGRPTNINNVETWFNIPPIIAKGPEWFGAIGSEASPGTKVFSLVGKVANTGLVEAPLGTPISKFVYDMGGGASSGRSVKAVQTGGPSGGCIPVDMFDTPADFESLSRVGSILSSGVVVVMDQDHCMVDTVAGASRHAPGSRPRRQGDSLGLGQVVTQNGRWLSRIAHPSGGQLRADVCPGYVLHSSDMRRDRPRQWNRRASGPLSRFVLFRNTLVGHLPSVGWAPHRGCRHLRDRRRAVNERFDEGTLRATLHRALP